LKREQMCMMCGETLDEDSFYIRPHGLSPYCIDCEQKFYDKQAEINGSHIALYNTCGAFNVPFFPTMLPDVKEFLEIEARWVYYNELIADVVVRNGRVLSYFDGETDIFMLFGRKLSQEDTAKFVEASKAKEASLAGTKEQRERWGTKDLYPELSPSNELYNSLDRRYDKKLERYRQYNDSQQIENIIKICKYEEIEEFLMSIGDTKGSQTVQKMREELMASEELRRKDEKPIENMRIDAMVLALEQAGIMEDKDFLTYPELLDVFEKRFFRSKKGASKDVVDQIIQDIYNTMRINADYAPSMTVPPELEPNDIYDELDEKPSEEEIERMKFAKLTPVVYSNDESLPLDNEFAIDDIEGTE